MPPGPPRDVDYVTGACLLLRADAVRAVGLLPEDYFLYFEETDYNQQLAAAGWRLVVDSRARAVHHKRSSGDLPTPAYTYYMRRNKQLFARRMGVDEAAAVEQFRQVWIDPWRRNVADRAPHWSADLRRADRPRGGRRGGRRDGSGRPLRLPGARRRPAAGEHA